MKKITIIQITHQLARSLITKYARSLLFSPHLNPLQPQALKQLRKQQRCGTEKKELAAESAFTTLSRNLKLASPLGILERGYAVVRKDGEKLFSPCQVKKGDDLEIILRDGKIKASVETE